ncbi:MAG: DMT family transporter [Pseudomonadota bacterium]
MKSSSLLLPALIMGIGVAGIPLGDVAAKLMLSTGAVEPVFIVWSRYGIGALIIFLLYRGAGFEFSALKDWRLLLRGLIITISVVCILTALKTEPIPNTFAAFFIGPIFSYFGAAIFLKEKISLLRTVLLAFSFAGVLMVVKPGPDMSLGIVFALLGGVAYGAFLVSTRWLKDTARPRMLLLSSLVIGSAAVTPWGAANIPEMDPKLWMLVLWSAAASALGNWSIVVASSMADASRLSPLVYMQVVYATLFSILLIGDFPDHWSLIGLVVLVVSGVSSFFVQRR